MATVPDLEKPEPETITSSRSGEWEIALEEHAGFRWGRDGEYEPILEPFKYTALQEPKLSKRPSWETLRERWNRSCEVPKWQYSDRANFRRDFLRAARVMLIPPYKGDLLGELGEDLTDFMGGMFPNSNQLRST